MNEHNEQIAKLKETYESIRYDGDLMSDIDLPEEHRHDGESGPFVLAKYLVWGTLAAVLILGLTTWMAKQSHQPSRQIPIAGHPDPTNNTNQANEGVVEQATQKRQPMRVALKPNENVNRSMIMSFTPNKRIYQNRTQGQRKVWSFGSKNPSQLMRRAVHKKRPS